MVRRRGSYRTSAQKHGGGKTRRENLQDKLRQRRRYLRENNLVELTVSQKTALILSKQRGRDIPVYGIYKDPDASYDETWVLTAMSTVEKREKVNFGRGGGYSTTDTISRDVLITDDPTDGLEIGRFQRKKDAMDKIQAETSESVDQGYIIYPSDDLRTLYSERFDKDEYRKFQRNSVRVYE